MKGSHDENSPVWTQRDVERAKRQASDRLFSTIPLQNPAQHFMLEKRGTLEVGNYADINVFDLEALKINSTFSEPNKYSTGMDYVIINGVPVIAKGEIQHQRAGKVLRHLPK